MKGRLLLDVVIAQRTTILELFAGEDEALLVRRNAVQKRKEILSQWLRNESMDSPFLVLDFGLDIVNCVARFHLERD